MAAVATVGTSFAQVAITGGVDFTYSKNASSPADGSAAKGIANTDAYIDIAVSEDLGGGTKATVFMELNADGAWGAGNYAGDKSINLSGPVGTLVVTSTRSGGILNNIMLAPEVNGSDHWGKAAVATKAADAVAPSTYSLGSAAVAASYTPAIGGGGVMTRGTVDAMVLMLPAMSGFTLGYKYVEGVADGYATPVNVTHVLYGKYASGPLTVVGEYNIRASEYITGDSRSQRVDMTATYDAGIAKVAFGVETGGLNTPNSSNTTTAANAYLLSALVPVGNNAIGLNYGKRDVSSFMELAAQYNFSKTTYVAASYGTYTNALVADGSSTVSTDSFGIRLGKNF